MAEARESPESFRFGGFFILHQTGASEPARKHDPAFGKNRNTLYWHQESDRSGYQDVKNGLLLKLYRLTGLKPDMDVARLRQLSLPWMPAAFVIALAIFLSVFIWRQHQERYLDDLKADFSYESNEYALNIQQQLVAFRQILRNARAVVSSFGGTLSTAHWNTYVSQLLLNRDYPSIHAIGFIPRIERTNLARHETKMRDDPEQGNYRVFPDSDHPYLAPIVRISNLKNPEAYTGMDLTSHAALWSAMESAARQGLNTISQPVILNLAGQPPSVAQVFIFQPIYDENHPKWENGKNPESRWEGTIGWVFASVRISDLIAAALPVQARNLQLDVRAIGQNGQAGQLVYHSGNISEKLRKKFQPLQQQIEIKVDGLNWKLDFEGFPRGFKGQGWLTGEFFVMLLMCLFFGLSIVFITITRLQSEQLLKMTSDLKSSEERFQFLATHDALTKTANRFLLQTQLQQTLSEALRYHFSFALIYVDLDKFKSVNDTLGHHYGDLLLIQVSQRVGQVLRDSDLLARNGGDEFVVLLPKIDSLTAAEHVAEKICAVLATPFQLEDQVGNIAGSLGISIFPEDGNTTEQLVNCADERMYRAKKQGGSQWVSPASPPKPLSPNRAR